MRKAARIVEAMHARIVEMIEPGMRKCDLVAEIYDAGDRAAPTASAATIRRSCRCCPRAPDASAPHLTWDDQPMKRGEGTFFEIAGCYHRYHCPLSRTVFLGKPPQDIPRRREGRAGGHGRGAGGRASPAIPARTSPRPSSPC